MIEAFGGLIFLFILFLVAVASWSVCKMSLLNVKKKPISALIEIKALFFLACTFGEEEERAPRVVSHLAEL